MGLHQKIVSPTESEPCNCGEDDDHSGDVVYTLADSEDQLVDYDELPEEEDVPEGKGFTTT